jgi:hypothetical protein
VGFCGVRSGVAELLGSCVTVIGSGSSLPSMPGRRGYRGGCTSGCHGPRFRGCRRRGNRLICRTTPRLLTAHPVCGLCAAFSIAPTRQHRVSSALPLLWASRAPYTLTIALGIVIARPAASLTTSVFPRMATEWQPLRVETMKKPYSVRRSVVAPTGIAPVIEDAD